MTRIALLAVVLSGCSSHASGPATDQPDAAAGDGAVITPVTHCTGKTVPANQDATWTIMSGGAPRLVNVHVPVGYNAVDPLPVVFNFHGYSSDAVQEALLSKMTPKSDQAGFIVLYPTGTGAPLSWDAGACCGTAASSGVDDIQFVKDLLATAEDRLCVDPTRVYATGMSNGGFMSHRIGCELADRFAAIAPVAGVLGVPTCTPSRPMPVMEFHGTLDQIVPWDGSTSLGFAAVMSTFTGWAQRDACTGDPVQSYQHGDATCSTYDHCAGGATVTLCTIDGGGHTWPGGTPVPSLGNTSMDISATDAMWDFFATYHL